MLNVSMMQPFNQPNYRFESSHGRLRSYAQSFYLGANVQRQVHKCWIASLLFGHMLTNKQLKMDHIDLTTSQS